MSNSNQENVPETNLEVGIMSKYKGACCGGAYEFQWSKNESCCYCCGIRCAMFTLCIMTIISGIETFAVGVLFASGVLKRNYVGAAVDITWGILSVAVGIFGYYGIYKTNERVIRIFFYVSVIFIILAFIIIVSAMIEAIITQNSALTAIMICDLCISVPLWIYIAYKIKVYHNLVFVHYQQLDGGDKENPSDK